MYKSNKTNHYFLKYFTLFLCVFFLIPTANWIFNPDFQITVNGIKETASIRNIWPFAISVVIFGLLYILIARKLKIVNFDSNDLKIGEWNKHKLFEWKDVESIKQMKIFFPPLYRLRLKNNDYFYFFSGEKFIPIPFFVIDLSEFGKYIKQKDKELELNK